MDIYKTRAFSKFAQKCGVDDKKLVSTVLDVEAGGKFDELGGMLVKFRIAYGDSGKSGGIRAFCTYVRGLVCIYLKGIQKKDRENLDIKEKLALRKFGKELLSDGQLKLSQAITNRSVIRMQTND